MKTKENIHIMITSTRMKMLVFTLAMIFGLSLNFCKYHHVLPPAIHEIIDQLENHNNSLILDEL